MLLFQDACGESIVRVAGQNGDDGLANDGSTVEAFVYEVNGAAGELDSMREGPVLRIETGKCGEQRRVDVHDAVGKVRDERGAQDTHVAGEANQFHAVR